MTMDSKYFGRLPILYIFIEALVDQITEMYQRQSS